MTQGFTQTLTVNDEIIENTKYYRIVLVDEDGYFKMNIDQKKLDQKNYIILITSSLYKYKKI